MRYSKQDETTLAFAKWCIREQRNPADILDLCKMAERVYALAVQDANGGKVEKRMIAACEQMRVKVKEVFGKHSDIFWPDFWPVIDYVPDVVSEGNGIQQLRLPTLR